MKKELLSNDKTLKKHKSTLKLLLKIIIISMGNFFWGY